MPIISLVHTKGGVAKTTSAMYLAAAGVSRGLDVVLVDADPQGSALEWAADATADGPMPFPVVPASHSDRRSRLRLDNHRHPTWNGAGNPGGH